MLTSFHTDIVYFVEIPGTTKVPQAFASQTLLLLLQMSKPLLPNQMQTVVLQCCNYLNNCIFSTSDISDCFRN